MHPEVTRKRRNSPSQGENEACVTSYKRFRTWLIHRQSWQSPAASTPFTTGRRCWPSFEFDAVCQRLELDSPTRQHEAAQGREDSTLIRDTSLRDPKKTPIAQSITSSQRLSFMVKAPQQEWMWTAHEDPQSTDCEEIQSDLKPFCVMNTPLASLHHKSALKLAAPSLVNDYYTNLLDCSCNGLLALALDSSVYIWNSETHSVLGRLEPRLEPGLGHRHTVSCLCWSRDGRILCIGTRRGEVQLWDVERGQNVRTLPSHMSVVRALSWNQQLLSSGSTLGHIHHYDPRAPAPLMGAVVQQEALCSLQWSPDDKWLASGSTDGLLHIWDSGVMGVTRSHQPVATMKQPSAVKAMGWCPWQRKMIATGGGWKDGKLRIWDTESVTCVTSVDSNSQICSLSWTDTTRRLITGHGLPHHSAICWEWKLSTLTPSFCLAGHSNRILHVTLNPDASQLFTVGADQCLSVWDI